VFDGMNMKIIAVGLIATFLLVASVLFFLPRFSYESELVVEGVYRNLNIGMEKRVVYEKLPSLLKSIDDDLVYFRSIEVNEPLSRELGVPEGMSIFVQTRLLSTEFDFFENSESWELFIDGNYGHSITLKFCNNSLCEIYRHEQRFELP